MQFTTIISIFALSAGVFAGPVPTPADVAVPFKIVKEDNVTISGIENEHLSKRAIGGIFLCTDISWMGNCGYAVQPINRCIGLDYPWHKSVSSMGPDRGTVCDLFYDKQCNNVLFRGLGYPGSDYFLSVEGRNLNDQMGSFKCRRT